MSDTIANIEKRLVRRIRADLTSPAASNLAGNLVSGVVEEWANELKDEIVIRLAMRNFNATGLVNTRHIRRLLIIEESLAVSSPNDGTFTLPASYLIAVAVKTGTGKRHTELYRNPAGYNLHDGNSFLMTPTTDFPVALVAENVVRVKPTSISVCRLDYIKQQPTITGTNGTLWDDYADNVLIEALLERYYESRGADYAAQAKVRQERAKGLING